jgi:transglutaminase-like putative cysteine protease
MLLMLPLLWTLVIDQKFSLEEQLLKLWGRIFFSFSDFFARRNVDDPIFMIVILTIVFWIMSAAAGFNLVRHQNYLVAVIPSAIGILVIQGYDNSVEERMWVMAVYAFLALLLLGRLHYLDSARSWRRRRIVLSQENNTDLTSILAIAAAVIIFLSWSPPASASGVDSAVKTWKEVTKPWREFTKRMENAVASIDRPSRSTSREFFGSELALGRGFPLSNTIMFQVEAPTVPIDQRPPRYYWRGRAYDHFADGQWYTTGTTLEDYVPGESVSVILSPSALPPVRFSFRTGTAFLALVYAPSQTTWFSKLGSIRNAPAGINNQEIISWYANPALRAGESYQVDVVLNNPDIGQLREAGANYPKWVEEKYLQLPSRFSPKISELAEEITAEYDNPYDKTVAVTNYLRRNIEYAETIPDPPRNKDPLEWVIFEYKKAYCVYYASAEVLMLRSLGIPARLAVGFTQGERDSVNNEYTVRRNNAHAWPEVYFPGIGWVEFEPTGSQPALNRPLPPNDGENNGTDVDQPPGFGNDGLAQLLEEEDVAVPQQLGAPQPVNPARYLILLFILFTALTIFIIRRYSMSTRIPAILRTSLERNGFTTPEWILNWERWVNISSVERSFHSINFALIVLGRPMMPDATPIERAKKLRQFLPRVQNEINALLDEHQTSLYTSREANSSRARSAAFKIRTEALIERMRYLFGGKSTENS